MIPNYEEQLAVLNERYIQSHPKSMKAVERAGQWLPGGNTRTVLHYDPFPMVIIEGKGSHVIDLDGDEYLDCVGEFSAGLYGHQQENIQAAIRGALEGGLTLGGPNLWEAKLAEEVCRRFRSMDKLRFCNSGTEANIFAVCAARAYTGRELVLVFEGAYHGGVMTFAATGNPMNVPFDYLVAPYNDPDAVSRIFAEHGNQIAAVLVEPILGAAGNIPATRAFLDRLRQETAEAGSVLIFDEVKTSRCGPGGMQQIYGITPDMTTVGKYLGGGLPLGAFGGKDALMARFDPRSPDGLKHAGTFNNNVLSMCAGYTGLTEVFTSSRAQAFHEHTERFKTNLANRFKEKGLPVHATGHGSMFTLHYGEQPPMRASDVTETSIAMRRLLNLRCMELGVRLASRGDIYLSLAMTQADLEKLSDCLVQALSEILEGAAVH